MPTIQLSPYPGVAEIAQTGGGGSDQHWLTRILSPCPELRIAVGQTDDLHIKAPSGIQQRRHAVIVDDTAGPAAVGVMACRVGSESDRLVPPTHKVRA